MARIGWSNLGNSERVKLAVAVIGLVGAMLVAFVGFILPQVSSRWAASKIPEFEITNPVLHPDSSLRVRGLNEASKRPGDLDVEIDRVVFPRAAERVSDTRWEWLVRLGELGASPDLIQDGAHEVSFGFTGGPFSDMAEIRLLSQPPEVFISLSGSSARKRIAGRSQSSVQGILEHLEVTLVFDHSGQSVSRRVPITKYSDDLGQTQFLFDVVVDLPPYDPTDPRYHDLFFGLIIKDPAGNQYTYTESYSQFVSAGSKQFGVENVGDLQILTTPAENPDSPVAGVEISLHPAVANEALPFDGPRDIELTVTRLDRNVRRLDWSHSLNASSVNGVTLTEVIRNDTSIAIDTDNMFIDTTSAESPEYQVEREIGGQRVRSQVVGDSVPGTNAIPDNESEPFPPWLAWIGWALFVGTLWFAIKWRIRRASYLRRVNEGVIDAVIDRYILQPFRRDGPEVEVTIMQLVSSYRIAGFAYFKVKQVYFKSTEPLARRSFEQSYRAWSIRGVEVAQGTCGWAILKDVPVIWYQGTGIPGGTITIPEGLEIRRSRKQKKRMSGVKYVASYPISTHRADNVLRSKQVGVLSISTRDNSTRDYFVANPLWHRGVHKQLVASMTELSLYL